MSALSSRKSDTSAANSTSFSASVRVSGRRANTAPVSTLGDRSLSLQCRSLALSPRRCLTYYRDAALPAMGRGDAWHWSLRLNAEPRRADRQHLPDQGREHQSWILAGLALAKERPHD